MARVLDMFSGKSNHKGTTYQICEFSLDAGHSTDRTSLRFLTSDINLIIKRRTELKYWFARFFVCGLIRPRVLGLECTVRSIHSLEVLRD